MRTALVLVAVIALLACGQQVVYRNPEPGDQAALAGSGGDWMDVSFSLMALRLFDSGETPSPEDVFLRIPGGGMMAGEGLPDLPVIRRMALVPPEGGVTLEIGSETTFPLGIYSISPFQPLVERSGAAGPLVEDEQTYGSDAFFPSACAELEGIQILRDIRVAWIRFQPVRYNPVTGEVLVTTSATVRLRFGGEGENELDRLPSGFTRSFIPAYEEVLGWERGGMDLVDGSYVVVSTADGLAAVQDLIDWKRQRGYDVVTADVADIGSTPEEVDAWIESAWHDWPNPPEYVLLAGGEDMVPVPLYNSFAADNIYGIIGMNTSVPSIHVGRMTGDLEDLQYQAWKVVQHECNPYQPAESWFQHAVTIGSADGLDPLHSWEHTQLFMENGIACDYYCDDPVYGGTPPSIPAIAGNINEGRSIVDYIGHGWEYGWGTSGFSVTDVQALTNGRMLPWVFSIACSNAAFQGIYCYGEAWMAEGGISDPGGALGFMGATTGSPFGPTDSLAEYTWKGYFDYQIWHMGAAVDYGKLRVQEFYGMGGWENNMMHMVFGCPEVDIDYDTSPLDQLDVSHAEWVWEGSWPVYVSAPGGPAGGARIGLVQDGILLDGAIADANGHADLSIGSVGSGECTLTVTHHNCSPYTAVLEPAPEGSGEGASPRSLFILGPSPTPFSSTTRIEFGSADPGAASVAVLDMSGRLVRKESWPGLEASRGCWTWDGRDDSGMLLPSGIYTLLLTTSGGSLSRNCVLLR
jgi:hypothetical protein